MTCDPGMPSATPIARYSSGSYYERTYEELRQEFDRLNPAAIAQACTSWAQAAQRLGQLADTLRPAAGDPLDQGWQSASSALAQQRLQEAQATARSLANVSMHMARANDYAAQYAQWYKENFPRDLGWSEGGISGILSPDGAQNAADHFVRFLSRYREVIAGLPEEVREYVPPPAPRPQIVDDGWDGGTSEPLEPTQHGDRPLPWQGESPDARGADSYAASADYGSSADPGAGDRTGTDPAGERGTGARVTNDGPLGPLLGVGSAGPGPHGAGGTVLASSEVGDDGQRGGGGLGVGPLAAGAVGLAGVAGVAGAGGIALGKRLAAGAGGGAGLLDDALHGGVPGGGSVLAGSPGSGTAGTGSTRGGVIGATPGSAGNGAAGARGGMIAPGGALGGGAGDQSSSRSTWLTEDDDFWSGGTNVPPPVIYD